MKFLPIINSRNEVFIVNISVDNLKKILNPQIKRFHFRWRKEGQFIISHNFSFGSDLVFDTNYHNTKSDIIVQGDLIKLSETKTKITLITKSKYWFITFLLLPPFFMLILQFCFDVFIPIPFYLVFPIIFVVILSLMKKEDDRLIRNFKEYVDKNKSLNESGEKKE